MTILITALGILALFVFAMMWAGKKAGDAVSGKAAKEDLNVVKDINKPLSDPELERVRQKWRRN